ncbi:hypothetical protein CPB83DRAFT_795818 [Crepidotus variabilis]|uniref:7alpha-cephem-methoxylase P8 chain n=1 Tax=Crepidotus variabilis TaxID=179855 RepID=A0A9P6EBB6_9AGAR|nr:hypothetical protein CPB83DRAFT_795818 [Crepidotus variabilis]
MSDNGPKSTHANIQFFHVPPSPPDRYLDILNPDGTFNRNYTTEGRPVPYIENLRFRTPENAPTLDGEGYQLFSNCPTKFEAFDNTEEVERDYYPESIDIVKELTGASQVIIIDHNVRRRRIGDNPYAPGQPSRRVHVDFSASESHKILRRSLPESELAAYPERRFQILSFWRPLSHAAYDSPLVLCDYKSVNEQEDWVSLTTVRPHEEVEVVAVKYNENHKWGYYYGVTPEEVVFIKSYDSSTDKNVAFCSPHTSFDDSGTPEGSPPRESIELRLLVLY